jgi:hypothetical protein
MQTCLALSCFPATAYVSRYFQHSRVVKVKVKLSL